MTINDTGKPLLTLGQAAKRLHVSEQTMRTYADTGKVPCLKIGERGWRVFRPEDVDEALRTRQATA